MPGPGSQIHDSNPSAFPPVGLFWTIAIPEDDSEEQEGDNQETGKGLGGSIDVENARGAKRPVARTICRRCSRDPGQRNDEA